MTDYILQSKGYTHFALLNPETGLASGTFPDAKAAALALPGDIVHLEESGLYLKSRAEHPPLAGILITRTKTLYGMTSRNVPLFLFHPYDRSYPPMRVAMKAADRTKNHVITARFESWERGDTFPRGSLCDTLGPAGSEEAEQKAMEVTASPFWRPSYKAFLEEDHTLPAPNRLLIASPTWQTINIDPAGCLDVDDTFSWRPLLIENNYKIAIGIADVDAVISAGSAYDNIARKNATTIYTPEGQAMRPMFPRELSEERLSLRPSAEAKPTISLLFSFNAITGEIHSPCFQPTLTQNNKTYTYDEAQKSPSAPLLTALTRAIQTICPALAKEDHADPHIWIQALMVFYNLQAAALLKVAKAGILRAHKAPDQEKLTSYMSIHPELGIFAMEAAIYTHPSDERTHFGFSADYCHATSPIRRYADLFNQRALKAILACVEPPKPDGGLLHHLNKRQKAAKAYSREIIFGRILQQATHTKQVEATVIRTTPEVLTLYVSAWKQIIKAKQKPTTITVAAGQKVEVCYSYDTSQLHWKERILFALAPLTTHP
jgi:exoribonuclease R